MIKRGDIIYLGLASGVIGSLVGGMMLGVGIIIPVLPALVTQLLACASSSCDLQFCLGNELLSLALRSQGLWHLRELHA